jgi:hypothetical protein
MKFDFDKFKEYVNTYEPEKDGCGIGDIIIKDMIYGIGISYDKNKYSMADGYKMFLSYVSMIHKHPKVVKRYKKLKRILKK